MNMLIVPAETAPLRLPEVPHFELPGPLLSQPTTPPRYTEHYNESDSSGNTENNKGKESKSLWERITNDAVAFTTLCLTAVTGVLALSTIGLWIVTGIASKRQSRDMQKSIGVAERSLTELEAPFVYVEITKPGIMYEGPHTTTFGDLTFRFVNFGRTPAHMIKFMKTVEITAIGQLPPVVTADDPTASQLPWGVVSSPNGGFTHEYNHAMLPHILQEHPFGQLRFDEKSVFFLGWFAYCDIFTTNFTSGFCFIFDHSTSTFTRAGGDAYNYLRKETQ